MRGVFRRRGTGTDTALWLTIRRDYVRRWATDTHLDGATLADASPSPSPGCEWGVTDLAMRSRRDYATRRRSDCFALAVVGWRLLNGLPPSRTRFITKQSEPVETGHPRVRTLTAATGIEPAAMFDMPAISSETSASASRAVAYRYDPHFRHRPLRSGQVEQPLASLVCSDIIPRRGDACSHTWARTRDRPVNSRVLCQLSYMGSG